MMKKIFSGLVKPSLEYARPGSRSEAPVSINDSKTVTLLYQHEDVASESATSPMLKVGDRVKTDQKLTLFEGADTYSISPVTGSIAALTPFIGDFGKKYTAIRIDVDKNEIFDDRFNRIASNPSLDTAVNFLSHVPGNPQFSVFSDSRNTIDTIVIYGLDNDLFCTTNQYILIENQNAVANGIKVMKTITGVDNVIIVVPKDFGYSFGHIGAEVKAVVATYPKANPHMIANDILGKTVPAGQTCADMGIAFFSAEAIVSVGQAFETGRIPSIKTLTIIKKDGTSVLASVRIGTPVQAVLQAFDFSLNDRDRIIFGGPMTGSAIYDLDQPILPDTNVIFLQDRDDLPEMEDQGCINCGECIRVCPVRIPVNMLVRFLSAGEYQGAADGYDLHSCIECGLCSYVCVSRIPIFQYIRLAKYELVRTLVAEEAEETDG